MRVVCVIQARTGSTRLPDKIHADIGGKDLLWHVGKRVEKIGIPFLFAYPEEYSSAEDDVLGRYMEASAGADAIMRVTSDCPFIDPFECQRVLQGFLSGLHPYVANDLHITGVPNGFGCEIFTRGILSWANEHATGHQREHVTPWIIKQGKAEGWALHMPCPIHFKGELPKFSVDTQEDLDRARAIDAANPGGLKMEDTVEAWKRAKVKLNEAN